MNFGNYYITEAYNKDAMVKNVEPFKVALEQKLGTTLYPNIGVDAYVNNFGKGIGIRYYFNTQAIRFNFDANNNVSSVDLWDKSESQYPSVRLDLSNESEEDMITKIITVVKNPNAKEVLSVTEASVKKTPLTLKRISSEKRIINSKEEEDELDATEYADPKIVFKDLEKLVGFVAKGLRNSLIVSGIAGVGKTYTVNDALENLGLSQGKDYVVISGKSTPAALYQSLYENKNKILVYDDCDDVLKSKDGINILKTALDVKEDRTISWKSRNSFDPSHMETAEIKKNIASGRLPSQFDFRGKVIFITNYHISEIEEFAKLSRAYIIDLTLKTKDILLRIETILKKILPEVPLTIKKETLDYCKTMVNNKLYKRPFNIKVFIAAVQIRRSGDDDWKELILRYA